MDEEMPPRTCSKPWCHRELATNYQWKQCKHCRERDKVTKRTQRVKEKAKKDDAMAKDPPGRKGKKKAEEEEASSSEEDEEGSQPSRQAKTDRGASGPSFLDDEDDELNMGEETFDSAKSFFEAICSEFKAGPEVKFRGSYTMAHDPLISFRERVQMTSQEIYRVTGYRFTVHDHRKLASGHRTRYWCSQDEGRKKPSKISQKPDVKHRDNVGMKRYPCKSRLVISCQEIEGSLTKVLARVEHQVRHVDYLDVRMPEAAKAMIREHVEWLTPVAMVAKVQASFPDVTAAQIHAAWQKMSQLYWRRDDLQLPSASQLLGEYGDDVDVFEPANIPEGVEILCWGMKKITGPLKGKIVEVGLDATYNTNSKHLELYSIMAEHDNAGFPLSYCLLSTATAIGDGKRTKALEAWALCLKTAYGVKPTFVHVDKDMAEIGMAKNVWDVKISLCWWHLRRAVRNRLANGKLSTTPYNVKRALAEFTFINPNFVPKGQADAKEYEGGAHDEVSNGPAHLPNAVGKNRREPPPSHPVNKPSIPAAPLPPNPHPIPIPRITIPARPPAPLPSPKRIDLSAMLKTRKTGQLQKLTIRLIPPREPETQTAAGNISETETDGAPEAGRCTFCPKVHRERIIEMMENHYCAHPLIPGYAHPSPEGIKKWAVRQMYGFCLNNELPEVWAYLWENWYRKGRWELWARSAHTLIPVLKTTMILESHWRRIKHDFLHHFHMPRCDLLVWVLVAKLAPLYYRKLNRLLTETGRYRELPSWRKGFKRAWRKLEKTSITMPVNDVYRPDVKRMVCTCPYLATSRFLVCKHLVQAVQPVPPKFFLEAKRRRTAPFWKHPDLKPLDGESSSGGGDVSSVEREGGEGPTDNDLAGDDEEDEDDEEGVIDMGQNEGQTFDETMDEWIRTLRGFANGLEYQRQFRDGRMLQAVEREGASFKRMMNACLTKERRMQNPRAELPATWEQATSSAMFYRARPACSNS